MIQQINHARYVKLSTVIMAFSMLAIAFALAWGCIVILYLPMKIEADRMFIEDRIVHLAAKEAMDGYLSENASLRRWAVSTFIKDIDGYDSIAIATSSSTNTYLINMKARLYLLYIDEGNEEQANLLLDEIKRNIRDLELIGDYTSWQTEQDIRQFVSELDLRSVP